MVGASSSWVGAPSLKKSWPHHFWARPTPYQYYLNVIKFFWKIGADTGNSDGSREWHPVLSSNVACFYWWKDGHETFHSPRLSTRCIYSYILIVSDINVELGFGCVSNRTFAYAKWRGDKDTWTNETWFWDTLSCEKDRAYSSSHSPRLNRLTIWPSSLWPSGTKYLSNENVKYIYSGTCPLLSTAPFSKCNEHYDPFTTNEI